MKSTLLASADSPHFAGIGPAVIIKRETSATAGIERMARSIAAVILAFLYALAAIWLTQMILWFAIPEERGPEGTEVIPTARWIMTVVCTFFSSGLSGFMAAHFARQAELVHGLAVGVILVLMLAITTLVVETEPSPSWYQLALPGVALPGAMLGAHLRTRTRRPPPPALPPSAEA